MKMMTNAKKTNKQKEETKKRSSITAKWVSVMAATITVSFVIFSVGIYLLLRQQLIAQNEQMSNEIVSTFQKRLEEIPTNFRTSNVVPKLSPNTRKILAGEGSLNTNDEVNIFNDSILATLSNKETTVTLYNPQKEVVFTNSKTTVPKLKTLKSAHVQNLVHTGHGLELDVYQKVYSRDNKRLVGYIAVKNTMVQTNHVLKTIRVSMIIFSLIVIVIFMGLTFVVISSWAKPVKRISELARKIDKDPNSEERLPKLKRTDELGELTDSFNEMLDRMQAYIRQQKQFVGDVSHELRTPVAVIQGHMNMLNRWGKDDPKILQESIDASLQEANRMNHLIQEMLDLTRAEQIDVQFPNEVSDVNSVLERTVNNLRMIHPDFKIIYDDADLKSNTKIKMYQNHLEQVLIILMDNAIKYSQDRKEIIVDASTERETVEISVQDFGEGIALEEQQMIFNRFYRVDKARTREKGGNGLGLSIAQKLVEGYHGKISVTSQLGSGSIFKIEFPLLKSGSEDEKSE
ncbi:HAMP domain-containing histidine kinase [Lactobacillus sp. PV037]|uniref:HAMP domain-containing sensor histidine kinase n=1 Tax=Lactobacillus sp. PV037 TaxID=2594496 RepID=UPI002240956F|nr:HAMP domain-containing histidine kinase [Lactobacillus sp. PV037]QNQ83959.1 HAMP domain-containing histidine kinase [Lactobacillus sp. PV037]